MVAFQEVARETQIDRVGSAQALQLLGGQFELQAGQVVPNMGFAARPQDRDDQGLVQGVVDLPRQALRSSTAPTSALWTYRRPRSMVMLNRSPTVHSKRRSS